MLNVLRKMMLFAALFTAGVSAETSQYFIGSIPLAGMVPPQFPSVGTALTCQQVEQALVDQDGQVVGFIPARFREPIRRMLERNLPLQFEVTEVYTAPQPGKFITVELWVTTDRPGDLQPLIYALPVEDPSPLLAIED
jgi:hypothetical protein